MNIKENAQLNNKPLISFVIPCFHSESTIQNALKSIFDQFDNYSYYEVIIACMDESDTTIDSIFFPDGVNYKIIYSRKTGVTANRNAGLKESSGEYVYFLDSDDVLYNNKTNFFVSFVKSHPCADMLFGRVMNFNDNCLSILNDYPSKFNDLINLDKFYSDERITSFAYHSYLFKRDFLIKNDCFIQTDIVNSEDVYFIGLVLTKKPRFFLSKEIFSVYTVSNSSLSKDYSIVSQLSAAHSFANLIDLLDRCGFVKSSARFSRLYVQNRLDQGIHLSKANKKRLVKTLIDLNIKGNVIKKAHRLFKAILYLIFGFRFTWFLIKVIRTIKS